MHILRKIALPGILLLGIIIRLISLNQSLWLDEATTALAAKMSLADLFGKFLPADFHPPFYYLLMHFWTAVFGASEISLRIPSVLFGVATVYIVFLISKKLFDNKTALVASILLATSGLSIYYSQEARMYSLATLLVSLLVYFFIQKRWIWFSAVLAVLGMTDYVSLLILPVFWILGRKNKKFWLSNIPPAGVFVLWSPVFIWQLLSGLSVKSALPGWWQVLGTPTIKNMALIPVKFILGRISFDNNLLYGAIAAFGVALFGYLMLKVRKEVKIMWLWLFVPVVLGILLSFKIPTLTYFRFLFCLPALYILLSKGLTSLNKRQFWAFTLLVLAINIFSSGYYLFNPRFQREDWRRAAETIGNEVIVFPAASQEEALIYYGKVDQIVAVKNFSGEPNSIWLSRYVWEVVDPADSALSRIKNMGYNKAGEYNFNGVVFWKFTKE